MHKHFLRLHDFGQNAFWQIIRDVISINAQDTSENTTQDLLKTWHDALENSTVHVWIGDKNPHETPTVLQYLQKCKIQTVTHDCSQMDTEKLEQLTIPAGTLHIACGFSEVQMYILTQNASEGGEATWLNVVSERAAHFQAMAEVAFLLERCERLSLPLDTFRICWLGQVSPLAQSLMSACIYAPFELFMGIPPSGDPEYISTDLALKGGAKIFMTREPRLALDDAHIIYMDRELEKLANASSEHTPKEKKLTPFNAGIEEDFNWEHGLVLDEKHAAYATKDAPLLYCNVQEDASLDEAHARRAQLHEHMFLAMLYYVSRAQ